MSALLPVTGLPVSVYRYLPLPLCALQTELGKTEKSLIFYLGCLFCAFVIKNAYSLFVNICLN